MSLTQKKGSSDQFRVRVEESCAGKAGRIMPIPLDCRRKSAGECISMQQGKGFVASVKLGQSAGVDFQTKGAVA